MNISEVGYWLFWILGAAFLGLCFLVTWWGLFGDRAKGRRRCPRCWYDLSHTPGMMCPECGFSAPREQSLFRIRRRLIPALVAAVAAALGLAATIEHTRASGWGSLLPTRLILVTLPIVSGGDNILVDEIVSRTSRNRLSEAQWESLINRCVRGDWRARPAGRPWQKKYGPLLNVARRNAPGTLDIDEALLKIPPWFEITAKRAWPVDTQPCLAVEYRDWWPVGTDCRVKLDPVWEGAEPLVLHRTHRIVRPYPLVLENPPPDGAAVFEAVIERRLAAPGSEWTRVSEQTIRVPLEITDPIEEILVPADDHALDEAVVHAFSFSVVKWPSGRSPVRVRFDPRRTFRREFNDVAVGVSVELYRDHTLARRLDLWWLAGIHAPAARQTGWLVDYEDEPLLMEANDTDGRWSMVVRGDPAMALRAGDAARYWAGEFRVPLKVNHRKNPAPPKDWWIEPAGAPAPMIEGGT